MAIASDGWFDWSVHDAGPPNRIVARSTSMTVMVHHSLEANYYPGGYIALKDPKRFPTAWHGTVKRDGRLFQHYDVRVRLSHAQDANILGPGFEAEGFAGEPLTQAQVATYLRIHHDLREFTSREFIRVPGSRVGLCEHREFAQTACPSGRYAPLWAALEDEMGMTPEEQQAFADLHLRVTLLSRIVVENGLDAEFMGDSFPATVRDRVIALFPEAAEVGKVYRLAGKNAFDFAVLLGHSYALGLRNTQLNVTKHVQLPHVRADHLHDDKYGKIGHAHEVVFK